MELIPLRLADANEAVRILHRHHQPVIGHKFSIGCVVDGRQVGVAIVGRPVARHFDDGETLEVVRCATDGTRNAGSFLYRAAWRAVRSLGYRRLITYSRKDESGASLRGAGFRVIAERPARSWKVSSVARVREDRSEPFERLLWEAS